MAGALKCMAKSASNPESGVVTYSLTGVVVDTTLGNCDAVDIRGVRAVSVKPSAGITGLSIYAAETGDGTYVLVDTIGTNGAVTVVASKWNVLTGTQIEGLCFIKMIPNTNGTVVVLGKN